MRVTISVRSSIEDRRELEINFTVYSLPPGFQKPQPPLASVSPGRYDRPLDVSLDCPRAEDNLWSAIYYTTDGSVPGPGTARLWDGKPVHIAADTTVKAVAVLGNWDYVSDVAELKYEIRLSDYYGDDVREWAPQVNVPPDKEWTIKFNMPVDPSTITFQNITVKDTSGNVVNVTVEMGNDGRSVIVKPPLAGYTPGQVYTLYIGRDIKSTSGLSLKNAVKMQFIIAAHLTY
ncbi:hypothetical protein MTBGP_02610 [Moorella thermoacetica]|uniref:Ig-like domain-containing protein n=1 Tax=Neomoorella thermoacetica TaxID=1525 RepID=UPI0030D4D022